MQSDDAEKSCIEDDLKARFLVGEKLVFWLVVLKVTEFLASADNPFLHGLRATS